MKRKKWVLTLFLIAINLCFGIEEDIKITTKSAIKIMLKDGEALLLMKAENRLKREQRERAGISTMLAGAVIAIPGIEGYLAVSDAERKDPLNPLWWLLSGAFASIASTGLTVGAIGAVVYLQESVPELENEKNIKKFSEGVFSDKAQKEYAQLAFENMNDLKKHRFLDGLISIGTGGALTLVGYENKHNPTMIIGGTYIILGIYNAFIVQTPYNKMIDDYENGMNLEIIKVSFEPGVDRNTIKFSYNF